MLLHSRSASFQFTFESSTVHFSTFPNIAALKKDDGDAAGRGKSRRCPLMEQ
jgi:hypothetical protein